MMHGGRLSVRALVLVAGVTSMTMISCKDTPTALSDPAKFTLVSGDAQSSNTGVLPTPLIVKVTDVEGNPKSGVTITWAASDSTAVLSAVTTTTDDQGQAQITWTLGASSGRQTVTASTPSIPGAQVVFQATNTVVKAAKLVLVSGDAQSGNGSALPTPLVVKVTDVDGNPKFGVAITWTASDTSGVLSATTSTTDAQGQAQITWTLGATGGKQTVTAATAALPGSQVVFQATNGGVLSGGVSVQAQPPVAFPALSRGNPLEPGLLKDRVINRPSLSAARFGTQGRATRRLIVEFKETGGAVRIAQAGAAIRTNMSAMKRNLASHLASHRISRLELSPAILTARVTVPEGQSMETAEAALRADATVASVTEDRIIPMLQPYAATPVTEQVKAAGEAAAQALAGALPGPLPNDPFILNALWHYNLVDAPRAWKTNTGSASVLVAVVDNGVRFDHPALGPSTASNLTQDGYNFVEGGDMLSAPEPVCAPSGPLGATTVLHENGPGPDPTQPDDLEFDPNNGCWVRSTIGNHGLHVAGTIGAVGNDGVGVAGLNWKVKIRPVRVLDITGSGSNFDVAQGVLYAAGLPAANDTLGGTVTAPSRASVINMSLGGGSNSTTLHNAIIAATNAGTLVVASAGNDESSSPAFPAAYPEVLSVTAVGPDLQLASYSNVGGNVGVAAPGGNFRSNGGQSGVISSTWNYVTGAPSYAYYEGTSMAAPHVVGVAALTLAMSPTLTGAQLRTRLTSTAVHVGAPGRNDQYGFGLVNAYNAMTNTNGPVRANYVRIVNATTGATMQTVAVNADGTYSASRLPAGSYYVYGGQDEDGDKLIGVPGRRFGWFGPAGGPTAITIATGGNASASLDIGIPVESKPHLTAATANRLSVNTYMLGQITASDGPAFYSVQIPVAGTYYFEAAGVLGTCSLGLELNAKIDIVDANGNSVITTPGTCGNFGASGARASLGVSGVPVGTVFIKVSGVNSTNVGQYRVWVRDTP
jgi:subtilisin family serine protease